MLCIQLEKSRKKKGRLPFKIITFKDGRREKVYYIPKNPNLPLVRAPANTFSGIESIRDIQKKVLLFARNTMQGKLFKNIDTGYEIRISRDGIDEVLSHASKIDHCLSIMVIPKILEQSKLLSVEPDKNGNENVKAIYRMRCLLEIGQKHYVVESVIKETVEGKKYYDHHLIKKEPASGGAHSHD